MPIFKVGKGPVWTNDHLASINVHPSEEDGWKLMTQKYEPIWHEGERLPPNLEIHDSTNEEEDDEADLSEEASYSVSESSEEDED